MTADIISSISRPPITWSEIPAIATAFGIKGARLLALPRTWVPAFILVSAPLTDRLCTTDGTSACVGDDLLSAIRGLVNEQGEVIVRSSVVGETIWDRGTYHTEVFKADRQKDEREAFLSVARRVRNSAPGVACGLIIQTFILPDEQGEFGNLQRISRTRDHWEYSIRTQDGVFETERFNSQRDIAPSISAPLMARPRLARERLFGSIAAWINNELLRGHSLRVNCEWVRREARFFVVQIDAEDDDYYGINPLQLRVEPSITISRKSGVLLQYADEASRTEWDKLAVLDQLYGTTDAIVPSLFYVRLRDLQRDDAIQVLKSDFQNLLQRNIVVRTSVRAGAEKLTNLPKTDCLSPDGAAEWCVKTGVRLLREYADKELAFVAHRYIASRASAWARADGTKSIVEVHGTWGLPDALQFSAYDIWEVHVPTETVTEYPNYKSHVLLLQPNGSWKYERVRNDIARYQSLTRSEVLSVASRSHALSKRLGVPCHIMWFVGCETAAGDIVDIPWYWTQAHNRANPDRARLQLMPISEPSDLNRAKIEEMSRKYTRLGLWLKPQAAELLRDNKFLAAVAEVSSSMSIPVVLSGSTLAHAYFQLRKSNCTVVSEAEKDHLRARRQVSFGKLVRDGIPDRIANQKEQTTVATVPERSLSGFLVGKFVEEVLEAREASTPKERLAELGDIFEVLRAFISSAGETFENVVAEADGKKQRVGGFEQGRVLLSTSLPNSQEETVSAGDLTSPKIEGEIDAEQRYRLPFTFFGFSELGQTRLLPFPAHGIGVQLTLQRDCIEIELIREPEQLELEFS